MKQNNIILTCFEPFGGRTINASYEVVSSLDYKYDLLPVGYEYISEKLDEILRKNPDYLILTGEAGSYADVTVELVAHNIANGLDNYGIKKEMEDIVPFGPIELETKIDCGHFKNVLISTDAGKYLCNYSYYLALSKTVNTNTKVLFVHFPFLISEGGKYTKGELINKFIDVINSLK